MRVVDKSQQQAENRDHQDHRNQIQMVAIFSLLLRLVYYTHNETTALMFVGIPTVLAVLLALSPAAVSPAGIAAKGVTIGLLISAILFGEGVICVLMAAPIAYIIAISR